MTRCDLMYGGLILSLYVLSVYPSVLYELLLCLWLMFSCGLKCLIKCMNE